MKFSYRNNIKEAIYKERIMPCNEGTNYFRLLLATNEIRYPFLLHFILRKITNYKTDIFTNKGDDNLY